MALPENEPVPLVPINLSARPDSQKPPKGFAKDFGNWSEVLVHDDEVTLFLSNRPPRCFGCEIPGLWTFGSEGGLVQALDGSGIVGIALLSAKDLRPFDGDSLFAQAASRVTSIHKMTVSPRTSSELSQFEDPRFKGAKWIASWPIDSSSTGHAEKVFIEIANGWLAQLSVASSSSEIILRRLIDSFGATADQECYWPLLQERYPSLFKSQSHT